MRRIQSTGESNAPADVALFYHANYKSYVAIFEMRPLLFNVIGFKTLELA